MLSELIADIQADFTGEDDASLVSEEYAHRAAERALPLVGSDLGVGYQLLGEGVTPGMVGAHREIWLVRAKILVCTHLRARAAERFSFASGDKKVDRGKESANWAALEKDLREEYGKAVARLNPGMDEGVLVLDVKPLSYDRGSWAEREG